MFRASGPIGSSWCSGPERAPCLFVKRLGDGTYATEIEDGVVPVGGAIVGIARRPRLVARPRGTRDASAKTAG